ncbi:MAG: hypothetical protein WC299_07685 [Kiritimatiellia bacterium]
MASAGTCIMFGEISGDRICIKTRAGDVRWMKKNAPVHQRCNFFDELFEDMAPADADAPYQNNRYGSLIRPSPQG